MLPIDPKNTTDAIKEKSPVEFWGLVLFLAYNLFAPENFYEILAKIKPDYIIFFLTFILAFIRGRKPVKSTQLVLIGILAIISILSLVASPIPNTAESYLVLTISMKTVALFLLTTMVVRTKDDVKRLLNVIIFLTLIMCLVSIYTLKAGIPPPLGLGPFYEGRLKNHFGGIGGSPNSFAAFLVLLFPVTIYLGREKKSFISKLYFTTVFFTFILSIVESHSRGSLLGFILALLYLLWDFRKRVKLIVFTMIILIVVGLFASANFWRRASAFRSLDATMTESTASQRIVEFKNAVELIKMFPLIGVGLGKYTEGKVVHLKYNPDVREAAATRVTHNSYLQLCAEIGIPGLVIFIMLLFVTLRDFTHSEKCFSIDEELIDLSAVVKGIKIGFVGFLLAIFFISKQDDLILYQWIALAVAIKRVVENGAKRSD